MIESIILVFGMGCAAFILLVFMALLDKDHIVLKLLLSFFVFFIIILMAKGIMDKNKDCIIVPANETIVSANISTFSYQQVCYETGKNTPITFYKMSIWMMVLYFIYLVIYMNYFIWIEKFLKNWGFLK